MKQRLPIALRAAVSAIPAAILAACLAALAGPALASTAPTAAMQKPAEPKPAPKKPAPARIDGEPPARAIQGCRGEAARPAAMALQMGKSTMLRLPEKVVRRSVGKLANLQKSLKEKALKGTV